MYNILASFFIIRGSIGHGAGYGRLWVDMYLFVQIGTVQARRRGMHPGKLPILGRLRLL